MPYPNYHTARLKDPSKYTSFRTMRPKDFPEGISVVVGINKDESSEFQSIRADKKKFSLDEFKAFLKENNFSASKIEEARKRLDMFSAWVPAVVKSEESRA